MKRGSKSRGKSGEPRKTVSPRRPVPAKSPTTRRFTENSQTEIARLSRERDEALEREKAAAEVLRVISSSPGELEPVFQAVLENATRICEAKFGTLYRFANSKFHLSAQFGSIPELLEAQRQRGSFTPTPGSPLDRLMQTKKLTHSVDATTEPGRSLPARLGGARSTVAVPLIIIDERATEPQRGALLRILTGQDTEPGATIFQVFSTTLVKLHDPIFTAIDFDVDVDARKGRLVVPGVTEGRGEPIKNPVTGAEHRVRIDIPNGFEYSLAEMGRGWTTVTSPMAIKLADSYAQFANVNLCQNGIVR